LKTTTKKIALAALGAAAAALALPFAAAAQNGLNYSIFDAFGGNQEAQKYSTADQITPANVKNLKKAWEIHTGDVDSGPSPPPGAPRPCS